MTSLGTPSARSHRVISGVKRPTLSHASSQWTRHQDPNRHLSGAATPATPISVQASESVRGSSPGLPGNWASLPPPTSPAPVEDTAAACRAIEVDVDTLLEPGTGRSEPLLDLYSGIYERILAQATRERELAFRFRTHAARLSSVFASVRMEGLTGMLSALDTLVTEATLAQEKPTLAAAASAEAPGALTQPFDALRAEVMPGSSPPPPLWRTFQRALQGFDVSSAIMQRIFTARPEVTQSLHSGQPVEVELSTKDALAWSTMPSTNRSGPAEDAEGGGAASSAAGSRRSLSHRMTDVTFAEQELALRVLQGLCLHSQHQRRVITDTVIIPFATSVLVCLRQHVRAVAGAHPPTPEPAPEKERSIVYVAGAIAVPVGGTPAGSAKNFQRTPPTPLQKAHVGQAKGAAPAARKSSAVPEAQQRVIVALIEAVEAACHYNPTALGRLVQCGGVRVFLNTAATPEVPTVVRVAALDMMSVLMQEVLPLRRAVAAGGFSPSQDANGKSRPVSLLDAMLQQAVSGTYPTGAAGGGPTGAPPAFRMDRASGSKFDSAVREWFSQLRASHLVKSLLQLRDTVVATDALKGRSRAERARARQRAQQIREKKVESLLQALDTMAKEEGELAEKKQKP